ncbi:MAG TPA: TIR domain-containing protein [Stellaceae bacterium]|nr:TIR domain-containing protein [Stellaceae bacterium]
MVAPVFISHASRDRAVAASLCEGLEQRGVACWISSRDIVPGENFQEAIVKALRAARVMVLVFTSSANNSDEIKKELALASQGRIAVIPVRVEDVAPNDAFSYEFATRQWIDAFGDWDRAIGRLAAHIGELLGEERVAAPHATPRPRRRLWPYAAAALLVAAVAFGAYELWQRAATPVIAVVEPPQAPGRLGHFSSADGQSGFVLDQRATPTLMQRDGATEILALTSSPAPYGETALRLDTGETVLRLAGDGSMTLFDAAHPDGAPAHRDQDARPLVLAEMTDAAVHDRAAALDRHYQEIVGKSVDVAFLSPPTVQDHAAWGVLADTLDVITAAVDGIAAAGPGRSALSRGLSRIEVAGGTAKTVAIEGGVLTVTVVPAAGPAGRPSSAALRRALEDGLPGDAPGVSLKTTQQRTHEDAMLAGAAIGLSSCGPVTARIDWPSFGDGKAWAGLSVASYCGEAVAAVVSACNGAKPPAARRIREIVCRAGPARTIGLDGSTLTFTVDPAAANNQDFVEAWLKAKP